MTTRRCSLRTNGVVGAWRYLIVFFGLLLSAVGCQAPESAIEEAPLETVDIAADPDFAPDSDPRAAPRQGQLAGILPSDFPKDLPIHLPASVDGFNAEGRRYRVSFLAPVSPKVLRDSLSAKLSASGWRGRISVGESTVTKAGRSVHVSIDVADVGSRYAYSYE